MGAVIRGSEVQDFLRCRLRWKYAWVDQLVPSKLNDKLFIGTLIHKWMEVYYKTGLNHAEADLAMIHLYDTTDTSSMDQIQLEELWTLAQAVTANYHRTFQGDKFTVLATELTFRIAINAKVTYTGTIDLLALDEQGNLIFADHKTTVSLDKYEKNAKMDRQISRYWWALNYLAQGKGEVLIEGDWVPVTSTALYSSSKTGHDIQGKQVSYFLYNIILKDTPNSPRHLKPGKDGKVKLSQDKQQGTTYELYRQEIDAHGLNPEDYADFLVYLQETPKQFFRRVEVRRNEAEVKAAMREFYETALDMGENPRIYRNITSDCSWDCSYADLCMAGLDGSSVDFLIQTCFKKREGDPVDARAKED